MKLKMLITCFIVSSILQLRADEIITEFTYSSDSHEYTYTITKSMIERMPSWKDGVEPPLSPSQAKHLSEVYGRDSLKLPGLEVESISLEKILRTNCWYYVVHLAPADLIEGKKPSYDVVIWMDGTIAAPTKK